MAVAVTVYIALAIAGGVAAAKLIEVPVLRLRDRWFPSRSGASAGAAPAA